MATLRGALASFLAATIAGGVFADDDVPLVKQLGDPARLAIHGAAAFDEAGIKAALAADIDAAVAARPDAPLAAFRQTLAERTLAGYLAAGYADAKVDVQLDPAADKLIMEISAGGPYAAGEVEIVGAKTIDAARLIGALTHGPAEQAASQQAAKPAQPKSGKKPRWPIGEAPALDQESQRQLREEIENLLYEQGWLNSEFTVQPIVDRERKVVALKIELADEGQPAVLEAITIMGAKKNSEQEILQFLGIERGMRWTKDAWSGAEQQLKQSGRFSKVKVRSPKPKPGRSPWLWIDLVEYAKAPPLAQPLSREEQALVRLSQWLHDFPEGQDELLIAGEASPYLFEVVVSPRLGALYTIKLAAEKDEAKQPAPFDWACVTSDTRIGLYSVPRGRKLVAIPTPSPVVANIGVSLHDGPPRLNGKGGFQFGLGMSTAAKRGRRRHSEFQFKDTAVSLLSLAHEYDSKSTWDGDVLTVEYKDRSLRFNGQTGRLLEFVSAADTKSARLTAVQGEFERRLAAIDEATRDLPNDADENVERPLSSVLEFLADEALALKTEEDLQALGPQIRLLRKLVSLGLLKPLDRLGVAACRPDPEGRSFAIPGPWAWWLSGIDFSGDWRHDPKVQGELRKAAASFGPYLGNHLLPARGWPLAVYREAIYAQAEKAAPADCAVDLTKLCAATEAGPLCCLSAAAAAKALPLGLPASLFAHLGQTKLSLAEFQTDYRELLDADSLLGEYLLCLAEVLRGLEEDEAAMLGALLQSCDYLDQPSLDLLAAGVAALREHRDQPIDEALAAALDQVWRIGLRERVNTLLGELAAEPPPSDGPKLAVQGTSPAYGAAQAAPEVSTAADAGVIPAFQRNGRYEYYYKSQAPSLTGDTSSSPAPRFEIEELRPTAATAAPSPPTPPDNPPLALDGFSAVTLVKQREWRLGDARYSAMHHDRLYLFANEREQEMFLSNPDRYSVGNKGFDIVQQVDHQRKTPGKREFGLFCNQQILLFESEESRTRFERNWSHYCAALSSRPIEAEREANANVAAGAIDRPAAKTAPPAARPAETRAAMRAGRRRLIGRRFR
ncbi:MAG TPA: hypothetical protein VGN42_07080 [Pirellulales bacterium]|jgi:hypothetical protein|nr:hypothetical protein [Pirellulales bacterium]